MPLNHYVTLGRSGLRVSPFCLGAMTFGEDWGWGSSVEDSEAIIDRFLERGGNFIDTANVYTERALGEDHRRPPRPRPGTRDRVVIATKFFGNLYAGDPNGGGAGRKAIVAACEQSLRRLQTDYIDLYWMHCWDKLTPIEETMRALDDLVRAGKVRYIGFSDTPAWKVAQAQMIAHFRGWTPLVALQIEYSLLERTVEGELMPMARELGLGVTPWSPLKGGVLERQVHARERGHGEGRPRRVGAARAQREDATRSSTSCTRIGEGARHHAGARGARVGAGPAGRDVDDHRRAHAGAARQQPGGAGRHADARAGRGARRRSRTPTLNFPAASSGPRTCSCTRASR